MKCNINSKGAGELANGIEENETILSLNLQSNEITDDGCIDLCSSFQFNGSMCEVDLSYNKISDKSIKAIETLLETNKSITEFNLNMNSFNKFGFVEKIERKVRRNLMHQQKVFLEILNEKNISGHFNFIKVMVIGKKGSGKTSTVRAILGVPFSEVLPSTNIAEITVSTSDQTRLKGPREYQHVSPMLSFNSFDDSFASLEPPMEEVDVNRNVDFLTDFVAELAVNNQSHSFLRQNKRTLKSKRGSKSKKLSVTENRSSLNISSQFNESEVSFEEVKRTMVLRSKSKLNRKMLSKARWRKSRTKFVIWDMGGASQFRSLHHLFFTSNTCYILAINLRDYVHDKEGTFQNVCFWLSSVKLYVVNSPIIVIATCTDLFAQKALDKILPKLERKVFTEAQRIGIKNIVQTTRVSRTSGRKIIFPVSNLKKNGVNAVREAIQSSLERFRLNTSTVTVKDVFFVDFLFNHPTARNKGFLPFELAKEFFFNLFEPEEQENIKVTDIYETLLYFNDVGLIIYLQKTVELSKVIVTDPKYLIKQVGKVLFDRTLHDEYQEKPFEYLEQVGLLEEYTYFKTCGVISFDLLKFLLRDNVHLDVNDTSYPENFSFLLDFMKVSLLMNEIYVDNEVKYLVPSLILSANDIPVLQESYTKMTRSTSNFDQHDVLDIIVDLKEGNRVLGFFECLVCLLISNISQSESFPGVLTSIPILYPNFCEISLGYDCSLRIEQKLSKKTHRIEFKVPLEINSGSMRPGSTNKYDFLLKVQSLITSGVNTINRDFMNNQLEYEVYAVDNQFPSDKVNLVGENEAHMLEDSFQNLTDFDSFLGF
eukprot:augustus_masked-scaffold_13-processed-gene-2.9-mRNA-1 protein AED:1.00 eAED:1.00 QI:0/-1/0/0/-1/1/1/0/822